MWSAYISGAVNRQDFLATALEWVSRGNTEEYMRDHRFSPDITELVNYFNTVIDWVRAVFPLVESEMRGLQWGELYERYHSTPYNPAHMAQRAKELYADPYLKNRRGVFEYLLGGEKDRKLLDIRIFDEATKRAVYARQTEDRLLYRDRVRCRGVHQDCKEKRDFQLPRLCHRPSVYRPEDMEAK